MSSVKRKIAFCTQCNIPLNRRILCIKRSWDEVSNLLNTACCRRCRCPKSASSHKCRH